MGKKAITDYTALPGFERKVAPAFVIGADETNGVVEHIVAVMGNVDDGNDRIRNGAFAKTITERGRRVKCLDQHSTDSINRIVGKPIEMQEIGRDQLPPEVLTWAPSATGGLLVKTQYALNTQRGRESFELVKGGFAPEASIGYDAVKVEFVSEKDANGKSFTVRDLTELRLWEYSNVVFGMNPATAVLSAKGKKTSEEKPYRAVEEDGKWVVYKLDADGKPTGKPLGTHDDEDSAQAQVAALYANTDEGKAMTFADALAAEQQERASWETRWQFDSAFNDALSSIGRDAALTPEQMLSMAQQTCDEYAVAMMQWFTQAVAGGLYSEEVMGAAGASEKKVGRVLAARNAKRILEAMRLLDEAIKDAKLCEPDDDEEDEENKSQPAAAEPGNDPLTKKDRLLKYVEISQLQLRNLEV